VTVEHEDATATIEQVFVASSSATIEQVFAASAA
jgi:hypothetical protein